MKKVILGLLTGLIQISGFSQSGSEPIKISKDVELIKISDHAYIHVSYFNPPNFGRVGANGLVLVNKNEAFLFDSPWTDSMTKDLITYISDSLKLKVMIESSV